MVRLLVTGGCGFIGSNFIRWLLADDPNVTVVNFDKLTYAGNPENLASVFESDRYEFRQGDISDRDSVDEVLKEFSIDSIVNFAAESHVDRSILDSTPFVHTNIGGTQVLVDSARTNGIDRFVQVSTDEVYGSLGDTGEFSEDTPLAPNSPYAASKTAADLLVRAAVHTHGFPGMITRCSNNYGPYQFPEKLIPLFISNALQHQPLPVYGDGTNVRDWIHVDDHCRGIAAVLRSGEPGDIFNFGGRSELSNIGLTRRLLELLDRPETLIRFVPDRPGHDKRYAIDCSRAEKMLGWKPLVSFEEGLKSTVDWYLQNSEWVDRVRSGAYREYYEKQYGDRLAGE
ncbi:MAG TPA: dTDP-glucose 4,6-dehydratase [Planctomycetaceae bacterium]|nr:dTDP-glucose 4,6-dehydratase [Planctomycetaceae bacterium]|tara:strand:- start:5553 stop:6578 length:1026 start_codon:yes stop_codon:yes gene_type:complete